MSILYLQNVLKLRGTKRATKAIIVSSALFDALYQSADLRPRRQDWPPLTEPACRKVIDAWLSTEGLPASAQLPNVTWHLVWFQGAKVVRDTDVGLTLNSEGPGSFEIV